MRYPIGMSQSERDDLSRGFAHGNYGNAYESQDWEAWRESDPDDDEHDGVWSPAFLRGALLGFFSSYELDEIADEELRDQVRSLRAIHDYDACAACGGRLPDELLRVPYETRSRHCGAECPSGNPS